MFQSKNSARGQSSVELLAAFGVYLLVAGLILESAHQLELPARTAYAKESAKLNSLKFKTNLAIADELEIKLTLNNPYSFKGSQISKDGFFVGINRKFARNTVCETELFVSVSDEVNATCAVR